MPGVREYSTESPRKLVQAFDAESGTEPTHIALDPQGDLFASDFVGGFIPPACTPLSLESCPEARFRAFKPNGELYSIFTSPEVKTREPAA